MSKIKNNVCGKIVTCSHLYFIFFINRISKPLNKFDRFSVQTIFDFYYTVVHLHVNRQIILHNVMRKSRIKTLEPLIIHTNLTFFIKFNILYKTKNIYVLYNIKCIT